MCGLLVSCASAVAAPPTVAAPKVMTDGYVDTTSAETIVEAFFGKGQSALTDEQKVLNFFNWYRRVVFPFRNSGKDRRDVLKAINTAGFNLCGSQSAVAATILNKAGYQTRILQGDGGKEWGHTFWEVKYGGGWHMFDAMTAFYVLTRDTPPHVAGHEEIKADPTLVTKAVEEKRVAPEFVYAARNPEISFEQRERFQAETGGPDVPWSLLVTRPGSIVDFWNHVAANKKIRVLTTDTYGGKYVPGVLDITLKANERYVRQWFGQGKWLTQISFKQYPPANMAAGINENLDLANFKFYEPYRQDKPNPFNAAVYRGYANGFLEWAPKSAEQVRQGVAELVNVEVTARGSLKAVDSEKPAGFMVPVKSPYGVVFAAAHLLVPDDASVQLMVPKMGQWVQAKPAVSRKDDTFAADTSAEISPIYEYAWKIDLPRGAGSECRVFEVRTDFQCNPMALPGLLPGVNKVRVSSADKCRIDGGKLEVTYAWLDAPDWKTARSDTKELSELPAEYEIKLPPGDKLPKMQKLEISLKAGE